LVADLKYSLFFLKKQIKNEENFLSEKYEDYEKTLPAEKKPLHGKYQLNVKLIY